MPTQNLVQIQRDLQSLPPGAQTMMYLKRAKDGMVASVPPYLAAAEIASREQSEQRRALAEGADQAEKPSVSQQLSQKADLLALQAMKKQALDRQSADQARTAQMPAPEGAPAPEEQPQPEGGIASLPVEFGFEGGGLVAFNGETGSDVKKPSIYDLERDPLLRRFREWLASREEAPPAPPAPQPEPGSVAAAFPEGSGIRKIAGFLSQRDKDIAAWQAAQKAQQEQQAPQAPQAEAAAGSGRGTMPGRTAADAITFTPGPGQQKPPQQRPPAAPGAQAAPAAPQQPAAPSPQQSVEAALMQRLGLTPGTPGLPAAVAPSMGASAADIKAAQAAFGLDKAAGDEERQLIADMRARFAQRQAERPREALRETLRGFSRGYGGASAAGSAAANRAFAEDMAHQQEMYKLVNAINTGNRKEAEKAFEKTVGLQEKREQDLNAMSRTELQALASTYGNLLQAGSSRYNTDAHVRVALAQARQAFDRGEREDRKIAIDGLQSAERGIQTELTKLQGLMDRGSKERRAQLDKDLSDIRAQIAKLAGVEPSSRAGAPAPAPANRPPLASFQR